MPTQSPSSGSLPSLPSFQEFLSSSLQPRDLTWPEPTFSSLPPFRVPSITMPVRRRTEDSNTQRQLPFEPHLSQQASSRTMPDNSVATNTARHSDSVDDASSPLLQVSNNGPEPEPQTFIYRRRNTPHKRNRKGSPCVGKQKHSIHPSPFYLCTLLTRFAIRPTECQRLKIKCTRYCTHAHSYYFFFIE